MEQLALRHQELYIAYSTFRHFVQNDALEIDTIDGSPILTESWTNVNNEGRPSINCDEDVVLAGHSFGGCTMVGISIVRFGYLLMKGTLVAFYSFHRTCAGLWFNTSQQSAYTRSMARAPSISWAHSFRSTRRTGYAGAHPDRYRLYPGVSPIITE